MTKLHLSDEEESNFRKMNENFLNSYSFREDVSDKGVLSFIDILFARGSMLDLKVAHLITRALTATACIQADLASYQGDMEKVLEESHEEYKKLSDELMASFGLD